VSSSLGQRLRRRSGIGPSKKRASGSQTEPLPPHSNLPPSQDGVPHPGKCFFPGNPDANPLRFGIWLNSPVLSQANASDNCLSLFTAVRPQLKRRILPQRRTNQLQCCISKPQASQRVVYSWPFRLIEKFLTERLVGAKLMIPDVTGKSETGIQLFFLKETCAECLNRQHNRIRGTFCRSGCRRGRLPYRL
jgi:hypothetical protein